MPEALITGSASGIGLCTARRLLKDGWAVHGVDRQRPSVDLGPGYTHHLVDLADSAALEALAMRIAVNRPALDALVHAAGIMRSDADADTRADAGRRLWQTHAFAAHRLIEALATRMPDARGRVVLVSSRAAQGRAGRALYAGSKAALEGVARSWAAALVRRGITVNVIAPAATNTPMLADPARTTSPIMALPIGRLIEPDEIVDVVELLLGRAGGAITGQTILMDGGVSLCGGGAWGEEINLTPPLTGP
jgi:NAD(P)-dependent dehydrogenase (short-subunit alcohol dehydrogenase family)